MMLPRRGDRYQNQMHSHDGLLKEALKQKMLSQEFIFKKQVQELHRLYQIQIILMKNLQLKEVAITQSINCYFQGILDAAVSPSHYEKHSDQRFLSKGDCWGTLENPVQVECCFSGETESSLDEVKLSLGIGEDSAQKRSRWKIWDEKKTSIYSQSIIDLEESTRTVMGRDIEPKSALGCAASSADSQILHGFQSSCSCPSDINKDYASGIKRSQSLVDGRKNCLEQTSLNQGVKRWLGNLPDTGISSETMVFSSHGAASIDLNKPLCDDDESPFDVKDLAMESSIGASCGISDRVFDALHKGSSPDGTSWIKPEKNCVNEVSPMIQQDTLNSTVMASNSNDNGTNRSGSKSFSVDLQSCFRSSSDHCEDHVCLAGDSQYKDAEFISSLPRKNHGGKAMTEVDETSEGNAVFSHLCQSGDTVEHMDSSPASCKSDYIATDPSSSLKTVQSGIHLGKLDLSRVNSFHNSESSQDESSVHGELKSGSFDEKKEGSAHDDAVIQKGAVSLMYFLLESSRREYDCIAEVDKMNDIENGKRDQPQCSSDTFESMVLKLQESNVEDSCVSSNPVEVNDMDKKDYGIRLKRGRRMKDFQKDILPGLASLARHEICEDIRIMEGVIRSREYKKLRSKMSSGPNWFTSVRSRRSRINYIGRKYY